MQIHTSRDMGLLIRSRRKELGLSQEALAKKTGVGRQWIVEIERGRVNATLGLLLRLTKVLELQLSIDGKEAASRHRSPISSPEFDIDLNAIIDRARGNRS